MENCRSWTLLYGAEATCVCSEVPSANLEDKTNHHILLIIMTWQVPINQSGKESKEGRHYDIDTFPTVQTQQHLF